MTARALGFPRQPLETYTRSTARRNRVLSSTGFTVPTSARCTRFTFCSVAKSRWDAFFSHLYGDDGAAAARMQLEVEMGRIPSASPEFADVADELAPARTCCSFFRPFA